MTKSVDIYKRIKLYRNNDKLYIKARAMHSYLENTTKFPTWIKNKVKEYSLSENIDFIYSSTVGIYGRKILDYEITIKTALLFCQIEKQNRRKADKIFLFKLNIPIQHLRNADKYINAPLEMMEKQYRNEAKSKEEQTEGKIKLIQENNKYIDEVIVDLKRRIYKLERDYKTILRQGSCTRCNK